MAISLISSCGAQPSAPASGSRTDYAFSFFRNVTASRPSDENVVVSPRNAGTALSMLADGAAGRTKDELTAAMNGCRFTGTAQAPNDSIDFLEANSLWIRDGFPVKDSYVGAMKQDYDAEVSVRDFNDPATAAEVNSWCSQKTNGRIDKIIDGISPEDMMFIVSALYFKAPWEKRFDPLMTAKGDFYGASGTTKVDFMNSARQKYAYAEYQGNQMVELPYAGGTHSMLIFLPAPETDINTVVANIDETYFKKALSCMNPEEVMLSIPKFTLETKVVLNAALENMGVRSVFGRSADLSGISARGNIKVSDVFQKCFIQVNEEGTEAAAVTSITVRATSVRPMLMMRVDRPFCFAILDKADNDILFLGKVMNL